MKRNYYIRQDLTCYNSMTRIEQSIFDYCREKYHGSVIGSGAIEGFKDDIENEIARLVTVNPRWKPVFVSLLDSDSDLVFLYAGKVHLCLTPINRIISQEQ